MNVKCVSILVQKCILISLCFKDDRKVEYANKVQELEEKMEMEKKVAKKQKKLEDKQKVSNCLVIEWTTKDYLFTYLEYSTAKSMYFICFFLYKSISIISY